MVFRTTLSRALAVATITTPIAALGTLILFDMLHSSAPSEMFGTLLIAYPFGVIGTGLGLIIIAIPLTYIAEKGSDHRTSAIARINLAVSAIGFVAAMMSDWPFADLKRLFWLHWGYAGVIFTFSYLAGSAESATTGNGRDA